MTALQGEKCSGNYGLSPSGAARWQRDPSNVLNYPAFLTVRTRHTKIVSIGPKVASFPRLRNNSLDLS